MSETATNTATTQAAETASTSQQQTTNEAAANTEHNQENGGNASSNLEKLIQSAVDRATQKLGTENKKLRGELEAARKAKLSEDEIKQLEMKEKEKAIEDRERALTEKENRLIAIKEIKAAGLDDGSDASLAIVDFVMAEDEEGIRERVKTFNALVERIVKVKVDGVFKANGRTPGIGTDSAANAGGKNESLAARLGKNAANTSKAAQSVLDHYLGGKK